MSIFAEILNHYNFILYFAYHNYTLLKQLTHKKMMPKQMSCIFSFICVVTEVGRVIMNWDYKIFD